MGLLQAINKSKGGKVSYLNQGGLAGLSEELTGIDIDELLIADGVDIYDNRETGAGMNVLSDRLKELGMNSNTVDMMRSTDYNVKGFKEQDLSALGFLAQYQTELNPLTGAVAPGGTIAFDPSSIQENDQYSTTTFMHELGHAIQNYSGTPADSSGMQIDAMAAKQGIAGLSAVQDSFLTGDVTTAGGYSKEQLTSNKQAEIFATMLGQDYLGMTSDGDAMAFQQIFEAMGLSKGGRVNYMSDGGQLVDFAPKGTDTVPAMLTPGEFVVNAKSAAQNMGLLKSINEGGRTSKVNGVTYAADGGAITKITGDDENITVKVLVDTNRGSSLSDIQGRTAQQTGDTINNYYNTTNAAGGIITPEEQQLQPKPQVEEETPYTSPGETPTEPMTPAEPMAQPMGDAMSIGTAIGGVVAPALTAGLSLLQGLLMPQAPVGASDVGTGTADPLSSATVADPLGGLSLAGMAAPQESTEKSEESQEIPQLDFSVFAENTAILAQQFPVFREAVSALAEVEFGVLSDGARAFETATSNFGASVNNFADIAQGFTQKTNQLVTQLQNLNLNGNIQVNGQIQVQPLQVNIAGLETLDAKMEGLAGKVTQTLATALATDNPGIQVTNIEATASAFNSNSQIT